MSPIGRTLAAYYTPESTLETHLRELKSAARRKSKSGRRWTAFSGLVMRVCHDLWCCRMIDPPAFSSHLTLPPVFTICRYLL